MIRYDTPEIAGFKGIVDFGEDDTWEVGLRYEGEFNGIKIAVGHRLWRKYRRPSGCFQRRPGTWFPVPG